MSYTKTLVPRSPSGINMIGECDIYYPLQEKISDWYPSKPLHHAPPPPPPPPPPQAPPPPPPPAPAPLQPMSYDEDEDIKQGVLPENIGPNLPTGQRPNPVKPPQPLQTSVLNSGGLITYFVFVNLTQKIINQLEVCVLFFSWTNSITNRSGNWNHTRYNRIRSKF